MRSKKEKLYLFIDTSDSEIAVLSVFSDEQVKSRVSFKSKRRISEFLVNNVDKLLKKLDISAKSLDGIVIVTGPGSFSGLRTGVATANALSFVLGIPLLGVKSSTNGYNIVDFSRKNFGKTSISVSYGKKPNITKLHQKY